MKRNIGQGLEGSQVQALMSHGVGACHPLAHGYGYVFTNPESLWIRSLGIFLWRCQSLHPLSSQEDGGWGGAESFKLLIIDWSLW